MENKKRRGNRLNNELIEKNNNTQIALSTFLLLLGIVIGVSLTTNNSYALNTSSRATTSNATSGNATNSNVINIIATSGNATNSNAQIDNSKIQLFDLELSNKEAKIGDKITINLCTNYYLTNMKILFKSNKGNQFTVHVNNLNIDEYIKIPTNAKQDTYYISQVTLESEDLKETYVNGANYDFNAMLVIKDNKKKTYIYNNEEITAETINEIKSSEDKTEVQLNATDNSIISKELFNSIKGTDKKIIVKYQDNEIIFEGKEIKEAKDIDVSIKINCISEDKDFSIISNNGYVINFADNGNLPGKTKIRLKATTEMKNYFKDNSIFIYFYDEENSKYTLIAKNVKLNTGYYEFAIDHNSKYIFTDSKITSKKVKIDENIVDFQNSNKINYIIIIAGIILILAVVALIAILTKKNTGEKNEE